MARKGNYSEFDPHENRFESKPTEMYKQIVRRLSDAKFEKCKL